jgi:hypothetical protein
MEMEEAPIQAQLPPDSEVNSGLDPILLPHEIEVMLGLVAGTRGQPLAGESSAALLDGWIQLSSQIKEEDMRTHPIRVYTALLLGSLMGGLWHEFFKPLRM